jgi:hypothetical protein
MLDDILDLEFVVIDDHPSQAGMRGQARWWLLGAAAAFAINRHPCWSESAPPPGCTAGSSN